jgi:periplasmic divalent cation tolerance protein
MAGQGGTATGGDPAPGRAAAPARCRRGRAAPHSEAVELGRGAVEARLAACSQVAGPVVSSYWWEGDLERAEEWLLLLKLPAARFQELADFLTQRHSYDEPEIVATPIVAGSAAYLSWIEEVTQPQ